MTEKKPSLAFLDANVFIEAAIIQSPPAVSIMHLAATGALRLTTCQLVIDDVEEEILSRSARFPKEIDSLIDAWQLLLTRVRLNIAHDPPLKLVLDAKKKYFALMRHLADIPVLASAIEVQADLILSGNRKHFNDATARKCGIPIYSCQEFLKQFISFT